MEKRGQFYLVAAIIITVIIMAVIAVDNYSIKAEPTNVQSLGNQIEVESAKTVDYGMHNNQDMFNLLTNFTQQYISAESRDKNLYFLFGTKSNITIMGFENTNDSISLDGNAVKVINGNFLFGEVPSGNSVILDVGQNPYTFNLKDGENLYFVISQQTGEEKDVVTG